MAKFKQNLLLASRCTLSWRLVHIFCSYWKIDRLLGATLASWWGTQRKNGESAERCSGVLALTSGAADH